MDVNLNTIQHMAFSRFQNLYGVVEMSAVTPQKVEDGWVVDVKSRNVGERIEIKLNEYIQYVRDEKLKDLGI
jgi:hypothetical protein